MRPAWASSLGHRTSHVVDDVTGVVVFFAMS